MNDGDRATLCDYEAVNQHLYMDTLCHILSPINLVFGVKHLMENWFVNIEVLTNYMKFLCPVNNGFAEVYGV